MYTAGTHQPRPWFLLTHITNNGSVNNKQHNTREGEGEVGGGGGRGRWEGEVGGGRGVGGEGEGRGEQLNIKIAQTRIGHGSFTYYHLL